jgi:peptidyl-prolyl cis-trans isomerase C
VHHILVQHAFEANDILRLLDAGKEFSELAQKYSTCSSAKNQGDLGAVVEGKADADFEEASLRLKPGEITKKPIRSRFGFHLIKRIS